MGRDDSVFRPAVTPNLHLLDIVDGFFLGRPVGNMEENAGEV